MIDVTPRDFLVLSILLTAVDDRIGVFREIAELERSFILADEIEESLFRLENNNLVVSLIVSAIDQPLPEGDMIELTPRGVGFCIAHEAEILTAALGGSVDHINAVRLAFDRIREARGVSYDSSTWTGLTERLTATAIAQIRTGARVLVEVVEQSDLSVDEKVNALACARAIEELVNAPQPQWKQVIELLTSKPLTAFLNAASLVAIILGFMN